MRSLLVLGLVLSVSLYPQVVTNAIQGTVTDETGAPISGAVVTYHLSTSYLPRLPGQSGWNPVLVPGTAAVSGSVTASSTGAFQTPSLPAGAYGICVYHPTEPYLDPCLWGPPLTITPPGTAGPGHIVLPRGVFMTVNVNDPNGLLAQQSLIRSDLTVGVLFGTGAFQAAAETPSQTGRSYQIAVPANQPLQCWIWSGSYNLSDENGNPIPASGKGFPFQAVAGVDQVLTFTVTGRLLPQPAQN